MTIAPVATRAQRLDERLRAALEPSELEIVDDSHMHAGHAGAADGRGHFTVNVVSERFAGLTVVRRHRLVYDAVGDMMTTDIHALSIRALAPGEDAPR
ncbi:MAG TPA: BolA family protein [Steroidobacteraceae bacterium]|jgi:BolA family transcriptional regulator, general stress-responsive regulator